jgi:hypothetical protein
MIGAAQFGRAAPSSAGQSGGGGERWRRGDEDRPHARRERGRELEEEPAAPLAAAMIGRSGRTGRNESRAQGRQARTVLPIEARQSAAGWRALFCRRTAARVGATWRQTHGPPAARQGIACTSCAPAKQARVAVADARMGCRNVLQIRWAEDGRWRGSLGAAQRPRSRADFLSSPPGPVTLASVQNHRQFIGLKH